MKLLELFKGTGSVGKVASKMGFTVLSLDFDAKFKPDIVSDILTWNYKNIDFVPDVIWASPPCNTYSPLAYPLKERDPETAKPKSQRAKEGTEILYKTLEIIDYFKRKNSKMVFIIENPKGMMRNDSKMKKLDRYTTSYNMYGDKRYKPTDFWSNINLQLKEPEKPEKMVGIVDIPLKDRYKIPSKLIKHMLEVYKKNR